MNIIDPLGLDFDPYCVFTGDCGLNDLPVPRKQLTKCARKCGNNLLSDCSIVDTGTEAGCDRFAPGPYKFLCKPAGFMAWMICEEIEYKACIKNECNSCEYEFEPDPFGY